MGALRDKMIEEMKLRNFASRTQKSYVAAMVGLARHYRQFPDQLTQEQIRVYLLHLQERGLSANSQNVAISGLRFSISKFWDGMKSSCFCRREKERGACRRC
jgi:integrase/recombinase XerD